VGTAKRERQKANRQIRLQELAKEQRKEKSKRVALRVVMGVVGFIAIVGGVYLVSGGNDSPASTSTSTTAAGVTTTTVDPNAPTTTAPPKPTVSAPGAEPTELKVTTLREGTGDAAKNGDTLDVHYVGVLSKDGTEFDNSYDRGAPLTLTLGAGQVIAGWEQGLVGVKVGGQYQIDIPAELAYGANGAGESIPPNAGLTFVVDIMSVTPGTPTETTTAGGTSTTAAATTTTTG
jgi:peptidylprolyl isomerase